MQEIRSVSIEIKLVKNKTPNPTKMKVIIRSFKEDTRSDTKSLRPLYNYKTFYPKKRANLKAAYSYNVIFLRFVMVMLTVKMGLMKWKTVQRQK